MGAIVQNGLLTLAELRSATCGLETVLNISMVRFSLILRAFFAFSVVGCPIP